MEIAFKTRSLRDFCKDENAMRRELGQKAAKALKVCLADFRAADTTNDIQSATIVEKPRTGGCAQVVSPIDGLRLVVRANHVENPTNAGGKVDWSVVSRIKVVGIEQDD